MSAINKVQIVLLTMLSIEEEKFIAYWEVNRKKQRNPFVQLSFGLPVGLLFGLAILLNVFSGWNHQVSLLLGGRTSSKSLFLVLIVALIIIVVFYSIFSVKMKWEKNEQYYRELLAKKKSIQ